jgi:glycosyltransferase involved in cell wall biosynthesis
MRPPARLLDLTRLVSRLGLGPLTGVDRVERAYLDHFLTLDTPLWALVRTKIGFLLLDRTGAAGIAALAGDGVLPPADLLARLTRRDQPVRARAETAARQLAVARCLRPGLRRMLRRLPTGFHYLNVGHANLTDRVLGVMGRVAVLVHDTIPLDHPEYTRTGTPEAFAAKLAVVARHADVVIHSTQDARKKTDAHMARMGYAPAGIVAALGVSVPVPQGAVNEVPPYFVVLGTIEPRKNHALLCDVWDEIAARGGPVPGLVIAGRRGWASSDLFARIDALHIRHPQVVERPGSDDGTIAALILGSEGLLFPSLAEGFGLPPVEAAALGVPVIASDLSVTRELLGDYPVYLNVTDRYSWVETIMQRAVLAGTRQTTKDSVRRRVAPPRWEDHFNAVLTVI